MIKIEGLRWMWLSIRQVNPSYPASTGSLNMTSLTPGTVVAFDNSPDINNYPASTGKINQLPHQIRELWWAILNRAVTHHILPVPQIDGHQIPYQFQLISLPIRGTVFLHSTSCTHLLVSQLPSPSPFWDCLQNHPPRMC